MDAALAALVGALIGTAGPIITTEMTRRHRKEADLRQRRHDAYADLLAAAYRVTGGEPVELLYSAIPNVLLMGSTKAVRAASDLAEALLSVDKDGTSEALVTFGDIARRELGIGER